MTLLVNSKTRGKAGVQTTFEGWSDEAMPLTTCIPCGGQAGRPEPMVRRFRCCDMCFMWHAYQEHHCEALTIACEMPG